MTVIGVLATAWVLIVLGYFLLYMVVNLVLTMIGITSAERQVTVRRPSNLGRAGASPLTPRVSVIVPAFCEEAGIVSAINAMLGLEYPLCEIVIVDDGSTDRTFDVLAAEFELQQVEVGDGLALGSEPIRSLWTSRGRFDLHVVRKVNGGRADALNAGISVARGEIIVAVDADSALERDALAQVVQPFVDDPHRVVAVGGTVRIANGSRFTRGRLDEVRLSERFLPAIQTLGYIREFFGARIGWTRMDALPIISGAFGAFRRDAVLRVGGFATGTLGEDMELVVRLRRELRAGWPDMRIDYVPEAVCWTEAPARVRDLCTQRIRWQRGLLEILIEHRQVVANSRHGTFGVLAMPYVLLFEALGPLLEATGYVISIGGWLLGLVSGTVLVAFIAVAVLVGTLLSMTALLVEEIAFRRYRRARDLVALLGLAFVENLGYRQLTVWWRLRASFQVLVGREPSWGSIERRAVFAEAASVDVGLLTDVAHVDDALVRETGEPVIIAPTR